MNTTLSPVPPPATEAEAPPAQSHLQLFLRFLKFGCLAWGGPVAQIAMLRRELVQEERWISSARFNRLLAVMQVLPGPEAHEMCVHLGMRAKGRLGGLLAGLGFMLPGFLLMLALSWLYFRMQLGGTALGAAFLGVQVAVIALIVRAVHRIGEHILVDRWLWAIAVASAAATFAGVPFWLALPAGGAVHALVVAGRPRLALVAAALAVAAGAALASRGPGIGLLAPSAGPENASILLLFISGLKAGLLTFGGAYTSIPFVRGDAVGRGWMTDAQFLDGLALSGVLPAPLIIFTTFVGYVAGGWEGALAMTAGVFLPAFGFSLIFYDRLEQVLENRALHSFLDGVAASVVGLIAATTVDLARVTAQRLPSLVAGAAIFAMSIAILYGWKSKLNVLVVIAFAAAAGWILFRAA